MDALLDEGFNPLTSPSFKRGLANPSGAVADRRKGALDWVPFWYRELGLNFSKLGGRFGTRVDITPFPVVKKEGLVHDAVEGECETEGCFGEVCEERTGGEGGGGNTALGGDHLNLVGVGVGEEVELNHRAGCLGAVALRGSGDGADVDLVEAGAVIERRDVELARSNPAVVVGRTEID